MQRPSPPTESPMTRPNIVFFVPDSYRGDVQGHLGNPAAVTPALDRLVADGAVSYANAFAQNPVCTPSRCSYMTGWYPHVHGHRSMRNLLKPWEPNLLAVLRREGYHVWWGGKNDLVCLDGEGAAGRCCDTHFVPGPEHDPPAAYRRPAPPAPEEPRYRCFYRGVAERGGGGEPLRDRDAACVRGAVEFLRGRRAGDPPFFLYLALSKPHPAYLAERDAYDCIPAGRLPPRIPDPAPGAGLPPIIADLRRAYLSDEMREEDWRELKRVYYAMCCRVDALFGELLDALQAAGLYDETLVVFFSDHGDFAGDYGLPEKTHATLQDSLLRVPLVIKPPATAAAAGGVRRELVELVDLSATLYDLLGIDPGYSVQGRSLRGSLAGTGGALRDAVFAEAGARAGEEIFINDQVFDLPPESFYAVQSRATIPHHRAGSLAVACRTARHKFVARPYSGHHELYDLVADPGETRNLAGLPACREVQAALERRLLEHFLRTADVLPHRRDPRGF